MKHTALILFLLLSVPACLTADGEPSGPVPDYLIAISGVYREVFADGNYARSGWICADYDQQQSLTRPQLGGGSDFAYGDPNPLWPTTPPPSFPIFPPEGTDRRDCRVLPPALYTDVSVEIGGVALRAVWRELTNTTGKVRLWCPDRYNSGGCILWENAIDDGKVSCGTVAGGLMPRSVCRHYFPRTNWVLVDAASPPQPNTELHSFAE
jgi:hypothetical protein